MIDAMTTYFTAESDESLLFVVVGVLAVAASLALWLTQASWRAMAWPLVAVALIQLGVGGGVYLRTPAQLQELKGQFATLPRVYHRAETARMGVVMDKFNTYKAIELALLVLGAVCMAFGRSSAHPQAAASVTPNQVRPPLSDPAGTPGWPARTWARWLASSARVHMFALGLGLVLQAGFMLVMDLFAEARGHEYLKALALMAL